MGNVFAGAPCKEFPAQLTKVPGSRHDTLKNPGTLQDINKRTKDLWPTLFEGAKILACKAISPHISIKHAFHMSSVYPSGYRFGISYCGSKLPDIRAGPLIYGEFSPNGDFSGVLSHNFTDRLSFRGFTQMHQQKNINESSFFLDYFGNSYTGSFYVCDVHRMYESGSVLLHYLQKLTNRIALGTEFTMRWDGSKNKEEFTMLSLAGRYCSNTSMICATVSPHALDIYFYQKANAKLHIGTELSINLRTNKSSATILYKLEMDSIIFKGLINSDWNVGATVEKCMCNMPISLIFSGLMNHNNGQFRMGIGMQTE